MAETYPVYGTKLSYDVFNFIAGRIRIRLFNTICDNLEFMIERNLYES